MKTCRKFWLLIGLQFGLLTLLAAQNEPELQVCIPQLGCLQGKYMPGYKTEKFQAFLGIPFAKPPTYDLRFRNPEPFPAWHSLTRNATQPGPSCRQKNYLIPTRSISGHEDCLYLNVYRPSSKTKDRLKVGSTLPIIFYIHGGGFATGSTDPGLLGPEYFMDTEKVLVVTAAYRLGPFGFLSTGDEEMPGNFGLKDQIMGLKWVQQHIVAFGGNPKAVTIAGHSSGGSSVHFHMLYEASKGLFQRAIIMSGSGISPFAVTQNPLKQAIKLAKSVGIANATNMTTHELVAAFRRKTCTDILNAGDALKKWQNFPMVSYGPTIEHAKWQGAMITEDPKTRLESGSFLQVPLLMGILSSKGEGGVYTVRVLENETLLKEFNENFRSTLFKMLDLPSQIPQERYDSIYNQIIEEYFQDKQMLNNETIEAFMEATFWGLCRLNMSLKQHVSDNTESQQNPIFVMKFDYRGPYSHSTLLTGGSSRNFGAIHLDDMLYLFRAPIMFPKDYDVDSVDEKMVTALVRSYVEFATNSYQDNLNNHKPCGKSDFENNSHGICNYLSYRNHGESFKIENEKHFNLRRMHFWENILEVQN